MYYPPDKIQTNLHSNGEFSFASTGMPYTGTYYKLATGEYFTGNPNNPPNHKILPLLPNEPFKVEEDFEGSPTGVEKKKMVSIDSPGGGLSTYKKLKGSPTFFSKLPSTSPPQNKPLPNIISKSRGYFTRYFVKKSNELLYYEIDLPTYKKLIAKSPEYQHQLYIPVSLKWVIIGELLLVAKQNRNTIDRIEKKKRWFGFTNFFKGKLSEYYGGGIKTNLQSNTNMSSSPMGGGGNISGGGGGGGY